VYGVNQRDKVGMSGGVGDLALAAATPFDYSRRTFNRNLLQNYSGPSKTRSGPMPTIVVFYQWQLITASEKSRHTKSIYFYFDDVIYCM
jgi:hypothetical protein